MLSRFLLYEKMSLKRLDRCHYQGLNRFAELDQNS